MHNSALCIFRFALFQLCIVHFALCIDLKPLAPSQHFISQYWILLKARCIALRGCGPLDVPVGEAEFADSAEVAAAGHIFAAEEARAATSYS